MQNLDKNRQMEMGQYLTHPSIATFMASLFSQQKGEINLLDPGAGVGTLTAAFLTRLQDLPVRPHKVNAFLYELDPYMFQQLHQSMMECQEQCNQSGISFEAHIFQEDFIESSVFALLNQNSLFAHLKTDYHFAILNPPYRKINSNSKTRKLLNSVGIETTNLYSAFLWLVVKQLRDQGEVVAIVPRSFCNGAYFRPFRRDFLKQMKIQRIHIFESRSKAFKEDDVLQENIILHAVKSLETPSKVTISSSTGPEDEDMIIRDVDYHQVVHPEDPDAFIHIVSDQLGQQISLQMGHLRTSLDELGLLVSTGKVVDFRAKSLLRNIPDHEPIPLIYPGNLTKGFIEWPKLLPKKPVALTDLPEVNELVVPASVYVLVKRFTAKEEKKRVSAAVFDPERIQVMRVGFENHLNYYHLKYGSLPLPVAKGLAAFLNSTLVDQYFRQFSGHTQVNATDLRNLKYPTKLQLHAIGSRIGTSFPDQDGLDQIISEVLALNNDADTKTPDPIQAKKRIREALSILQMFSLPRAQLNDRSALTLLALLDIKATTSWREAANPLIGITEMMNFFHDYYGISYAPNTRETVRRGTVHQFLQVGLITVNPDDPERPINSPKTRYQVEEAALNLIRSFGTDAWEINLKDYLTKAPDLARLQMKEREMALIPVTLPNGVQVLLSPGGQNELN